MDLRKHSLYSPLFKGISEYKKNVDAMLSDKVQACIIHHAERDAVLIKFNWQIPSAIIIAWAQYHHLDARIEVDAAWGVCLYILLSALVTTRATFQPTPHPHSFLTVTSHCIAADDNIYFNALSLAFETCINTLKSWRVGHSGPRVSYHLFGNKTLLPSLHLVQRDASIQDALIALPNGLPVDVVIDWLQSHEAAFHWVNDTVHGRCLCLTEININVTHAQFNPATSNGDWIGKYVPLLSGPRR
jgi:hypothetical protein